jgi:hypothetical protein
VGCFGMYRKHASHMQTSATLRERLTYALCPKVKQNGPE